MSNNYENFGKYILLEKLAMGGMAEVFLSRSNGASGISKFLALKRILPQYSDNPEYIEMFKKEAKIAVNLNHSNVVSIFDFGVEKGQFFLVMEYVEGRNLRQILNHLKKTNYNFSIDQIVYMIKEASAGLDHAHRCLDGTTGRPLNIVHRDISPQNIMISFEGEIKIVDFGIAKEETQTEHTKAGTLKGKYGYMSPEQADGHNVDLRTDLFSLGIVLWELLANDRLFTSNNDLNILRKIRDCQIPSLRKINPSVHPELERICNKILSKDPSLRYQTASALHRDLNRFLNTQYPEFSSHDFSVFMKTVFSDVVIDNRKKMVEYASAGHNIPGENTEVTATMTQPSLNHSVSISMSSDNPMTHLPPPPPNKNKSTSDDDLADLGNAGKVNLSDLKMGGDRILKQAGFAQTKENTFTRSTYTQTSRLQTNSKSSHSVNWVNLTLSAIIIFAVSLIFKDKLMEFVNPPSKNFVSLKSNTNKNDSKGSNSNNQINQNTNQIQGNADLSQVGQYVVVIESQPSNAQIFIDDVDTGKFTPGRIQVEANKDFKLSLKKDGYLPYTISEKAEKNAHSIKATLMQSAIGYVYINLKGGGADPVIVVNGVRLSEKPPIKLYAVPAKIPILIRAYDPFSKKSTEQTITVNPDQKRYVELNLIK